MIWIKSPGSNHLEYFKSFLIILQGIKPQVKIFKLFCKKSNIKSKFSNYVFCRGFAGLAWSQTMKFRKIWLPFIWITRNFSRSKTNLTFFYLPFLKPFQVIFMEFLVQRQLPSLHKFFFQDSLKYYSRHKLENSSFTFV